MRAISGETHKACMQVIEDLRKGNWPAGTLGAQYCDIEIGYRGAKHLLVALDYPGEVFRKAFVDNSDTEDARELLDHVDRAAAVLILLDAEVIESGALHESIDDDYGMVQAVNRIREWPNGHDVPIVIVFTKCDVRKHLLRDSGGLRAFTLQHYKNLIRASGKFKVFACAAVHTKRSDAINASPNMEPEPIGVVEPLEYCLGKITEQTQEKATQKATKERVEAYRQQAQVAFVARKRMVLFWSIFWSVAMFVIGGVAIVTWMLVNAPEIP